ncbi:MAG TPA: hypothetical protein VFV39_05480, partial [Limnobacter sp.]|nr:hypothetical protein [Limnobacter sp.]
IEASQKQGIFSRPGQRRGPVKNCATEKATDLLQKSLTNDPSLAELYRNQVQRLRALKQLRQYYTMRFWLELWLAVHVPLSFGLLAALLTHVISVFVYW